MTLPGFIDTIFQWLGYGQYNTSPPTAVNGQPVPFQSDVNGNLKVAIASNTSQATKSWDMTTAPTNKKLAIKTGPGSIYAIEGVNESASAIWLMVFDSVSQPTNGAAPLFPAIYVPANTAYSFTDTDGIPFATGLSWVASSTTGTLTYASGATISAMVKKA